MAIEIKAPVFPESVSEGTLMTWYKQPGEVVHADEKLAEIETDKIVLEVAAQASGKLSSVLKKEGDTVTTGEIIAELEEGDVLSEPAPAKQAAPADSAPAKEEHMPEAPAPVPAPQPAPAAEKEAPIAGSGPAAAKMMAEHGIDPATVKGTGPGGRITKADLVPLIAATPAAQPSTPAPAPSAAPTPVTPLAAVPVDPAGRSEERVPMSRIRARIAERLVQAQHTAAILTTFNEVNMKPVMDLRNKYKKEFENEHGVKLGFMSFFVMAAVEALKRFPAVNASVDGTDIIYHGFYDIGIAVSSPRGLVVPILRNADHLSFAEAEAAVRDFGTRAQENKLSLEELQGGTFSISNGGIFGSLLSTPILNPPQSAILGMHNITQRAVVENGDVVARPVMFLALSYDHRIVDGREAVLFLVTIKEMLEDPSRLLLNV